MNVVALLIAACAFWWLLSISFHVGSIAAASIQPWLGRRHAKRQDQPPVSVLIPVKEMTPELEAAFVSLYSQSYPRFEVLVSTTDQLSPPLELARNIAAQFPSIKSRFICHDPHVALNAKLNNLATPFADAEYNLIFVKDSNIHLDQHQLAELVRYLIDNVGLVVAVPIGIQPANFSAHLECAIMNGYVGRFLLAASAIGWGFGIGAIMLFDRRDFSRAGGIASIAEAVGEDHALSKALARIGLKTFFAPNIVTQVVGKRSFSDVWARQIRWMVCRRIEEPAAYYVEPFIGLVFTTIVGTIGASFFDIQASLLAAGTVFVWAATEIFFMAIKGWGLSWKSPFAIICSELMLPVLWFQASMVRKISWGGAFHDIRRTK